MDFPPEWVVTQMEDFNMASLALQGEFGIELLAQLRATGRILDNFHFALDGATPPTPLDMFVDLANIIPVAPFEG
jgi:hypothetical protein